MAKKSAIFYGKPLQTRSVRLTDFAIASEYKVMQSEVKDPTLRGRIKSLVALADDPSEIVQHYVGDAIEHYEDNFDEICQKLQIKLSDNQRESVELLLAHRHREQQKQEIQYRQEHPRYRIGQVIRHCRYGYTGVIVAVDHSFCGDLQWYAANKSHPNRDQPWYHILVDESKAATYTAESSLNGDILFQEIKHPAIERFFNAHDNSIYLRNDEPWPD